MPVFAEWDRMMQEHALNLLRYERAAKDWEKLAAQLKSQHKPLPPPPEKPVGPGGPFTPGGLFNAMVAPITPMAIRGVIWYQGEANGSVVRAPLYGRLFQAMITDWRRAWGIGDFPFLYVQLANYNAPESAWPELREGQRQALALRNTAMAVTIDIGTPDNIHPPDKKTVGTRLALAARAVAYGETVEYSGPMLRQVTARRRRAARLVRLMRRPDRAGRRGERLRGRRRGPQVRRGRSVASKVRPSWCAVPRSRSRCTFATAGATTRTAICSTAAGLPASPFRKE